MYKLYMISNELFGGRSGAGRGLKELIWVYDEEKHFVNQNSCRALMDNDEGNYLCISFLLVFISLITIQFLFYFRKERSG